MEINTTYQIKQKEQEAKVASLSKIYSEKKKALQKAMNGLRDQNVDSAYAGEIILANMGKDMFSSFVEAFRHISEQAALKNLNEEKEILEAFGKYAKDEAQAVKDVNTFKDIDLPMLVKLSILETKKEETLSAEEIKRIDKEIENIDKKLQPTLDRYGLASANELRALYNEGGIHFLEGTTPFFDAVDQKLKEEDLANIIDVTDDESIKGIIDRATQGAKDLILGQNSENIAARAEAERKQSQAETVEMSS